MSSDTWLASLIPTCGNHLEGKVLLDQVQVQVPYTALFWGHSRTLRYDIGCPTLCEIIILGDTMIPSESFDFDPPTLQVPGCPFFGKGGQEGSKLVAYCGRCASVWTQVLTAFCLYMEHQTNGGGPGSKLWDPPPPPPAMVPCW